MTRKNGPARRSVLAGAAAAVFLPGAVRAQAWPSRTITLVVPFAPGGGTDTFARPFAAKLSQELGQQVVIDNRAGAGGTVGAAIVAKTKPDGYTFLLGSVHHAVAVTAYKQLPYDLQKDLVAVTSVASVPDVLVIYPGIPATTLQEFIAYCKANPGKTNFGSAGLGTTRHLAGEIFNAKTGTAMTHVPYKGVGPRHGGTDQWRSDCGVRRTGQCGTLYPQRQGEGAGGVFGRALASISRHSDGRRSRIGGLRIAVLVRALGAGRHRRRHCLGDAGSCCKGIHGGRPHQDLARARGGAGWGAHRSLRGLCHRRDREMG